jgi:hypothetical protein
MDDPKLNKLELSKALELKAGLFEKFEFESEDNLSEKLKRSFFGSLPISSINALRKTCRKFNKVFSFENPSSEFFSYRNSNIVRKDIKRKFIVALYDKNDELVESISHHPKVSCTISYSLIEDICLFPFKKKNHWRLRIVGDIESALLKTVCDHPFPLLSAYISGNRDLEPYIKTMDLVKESDKLLLILKLLIANKDISRFLKLKNCFPEHFIKNIGKDLIATALEFGINSILVTLIDNDFYENINEIRTWNINGQWIKGTLLDSFYLKYEEKKALENKKDSQIERKFIGDLIYSLRQKNALTQKEVIYKNKRNKEIIEIIEITTEPDSEGYCCCQ